MVKATWRPRKERGNFEVMVRDGRRRLFTRSFKTKGDAQQAAREINRVSMQGVEIRPPVKSAGDLAPLREGLPAFITLMEQQREWQGSTPSRYLRRLQQEFFDFKLADGCPPGELRPFDLPG